MLFKRNFKDLLKSDVGKYVISLLLGFGLVSLFRKSCNNRNCIVFRGPKPDNIKDKIFKYNDKCYTYTSKNISCNTHKQVEIE